MTRDDLAALIDHTTLGAEADVARIEQLCREAREHGFKTVVVQPCRVALAVELMSGSGIEVGTVAGFPFGANETAIKAAEAAHSVRLGAADIDMVMNVGWAKDNRWSLVRDDIAAVVEAGRQAGGGRRITLKVIIEAGLLTDAEKELAAAAVKEAGADFVKTSTGYLGSGANAADVALLRRAVGDGFGVKASGGIRTLEQFKAMVAAGADRIGTSAGVAIVDELETAPANR